MTLKEDLDALGEVVLTLVPQTPKQKIRAECNRKSGIAHGEYQSAISADTKEYYIKRKAIDTDLNAHTAAAYESHRAKAAALEAEYMAIYAPHYDAYREKCKAINQEFTREYNALEEAAK